LALALDGSLLLNAGPRLDAALVAQVAKALDVPAADVFIATRLPPIERHQTLVRMDDAAAEAAARIHGSAAAISATKTRKKRAPR
jgi:hypothetical protein